MLFGDVSISSEDLATVLCREVRARANTFPANPTGHDWTAIIKEVLCKVGEHRKYEVLCRGINEHHEWLLDVVWWKQHRERGRGSARAGEGEWECKDLMWDFQKLLCVKAPLKVFIYDGGNIPEHGEMERKQFEGEMRVYPHHVAGEEYLFVSFGNTGQYAHHFVVPRDGALEHIEFEYLETVESIGRTEDAHVVAV